MKLLVLTANWIIGSVCKENEKFHIFCIIQKYFEDYVRGCEKKEENFIGHNHLFKKANKPSCD